MVYFFVYFDSILAVWVLFMHFFFYIYYVLAWFIGWMDGV